MAQLTLACILGVLADLGPLPGKLRAAIARVKYLPSYLPADTIVFALTTSPSKQQAGHTHTLACVRPSRATCEAWRFLTCDFVLMVY